MLAPSSTWFRWAQICVARASVSSRIPVVGTVALNGSRDADEYDIHPVILDFIPRCFQLLVRHLLVLSRVHCAPEGPGDAFNAGRNVISHHVARMHDLEKADDYIKDYKALGTETAVAKQPRTEAPSY